jgi:hypothetical protein
MFWRKSKKTYRCSEETQELFSYSIQYRNGRPLSNVKGTHVLTTVPPTHLYHFNLFHFFLKQSPINLAILYTDIINDIILLRML